MLVRIQQLIFLILLMFPGFCTGMFIASSVSTKPDGFTGPATAIWYGIAGLVAGLISGLFLIRKMKGAAFLVAFVIAGITSLIVCGWIIYRVKSLNDERRNAGIGSTQPPTKKGISSFVQHAGFFDTDTQTPAGMGMASPRLENDKVIYFYAAPSFDELPEQSNAFDSLVIIKGKYHFEISYAPPWFYPEIQKLDYGMLILRVLTISKNWIEVVTNKQTGQTNWISRMDVDFIEWPSFLLNVFSVEIIEPGINPLRYKPLDHAGIIATTPERFSLSPVAIRGDWIMVSTLGLADRIVPTGWIRWRRNDSLLIRYSLLS